MVLHAGLKLLNVERSFAEQHYADLSAKPFFNGLVDYIISGPVVAMVWEGKNVVVTGRKIIGATNPAESAPGTIRGDYAVEIGRETLDWFFSYVCFSPIVTGLPSFLMAVLEHKNAAGSCNLRICFCSKRQSFFALKEYGFLNVIHGSDSIESARKEIALWFPDGIVDWQSSLHPWICE
ncbi:Nucleoside diphosphate kinase 1-like protein [Drosera capensis]